MQAELYEDLESILPEWEELFRADPQATPFTAPGWARAWWRWWADSAMAWLVAVRDGGALVALAPFVVRRRGPFRVLAELGTHPSRDIVALPDKRAEAARVVAEEILRRHEEWDALIVKCFPGASLIVPSLRDAGLRSQLRGTAPYPGIALPTSFDEYLDSLPRKRRKDLRRHLRKLDEGDLELRGLEDPGEVAAAVDRWQALKLSWWDAREGEVDPGQRGPRFVGFLRDLMAELVPAGLAEVWELRLSDEVVGVEISLVDQSTFYAWQGGYSPSIANLGPGKVATGVGIRSAIGAGRRYYDFMRGGQDYKYWYGARDRHAQTLAIGSERLKSRGALLALTGAARLRGRGRAGKAEDPGE